MTPLVYSSELGGRLCPGCGQAVKSCICHQRRRNALPADTGGKVRVLLETKGRKGKAVTLIAGLPMSPERMSGYLKELKQKFGTGGTVKDGVIELQGDYRQELLKELQLS